MHKWQFQQFEMQSNNNNEFYQYTIASAKQLMSTVNTTPSNTTIVHGGCSLFRNP